MKTRTILALSGKTVLLIVLFVITFMIAVIIMPEGQEIRKALSPADAQLSGILLIANSAILAVLTAVAIRRSGWKGWKLTGGLFAASYGFQIFMTQLETLFFKPAFLSITDREMAFIFLRGLVSLALFMPLAVLILGKFRRDAQDIGPSVFRWTSLVSRFLILGLAYVAVYYLFGYFVAWQFPEVRLFYTKSTQILGFFRHTAAVIGSTPVFLPFQFLRGLLWTLLGLPLVLMFRANRKIEAIILAALFYAVWPSTQLMFPNPFMPGGVRFAHFIEIFSSNLLFGTLVGLFLPGAVRDKA